MPCMLFWHYAPLPQDNSNSRSNIGRTGKPKFDTGSVVVNAAAGGGGLRAQGLSDRGLGNPNASLCKGSGARPEWPERVSKGGGKRCTVSGRRKRLSSQLRVRAMQLAYFLRLPTTLSHVTVTGPRHCSAGRSTVAHWFTKGQGIEEIEP